MSLGVRALPGIGDLGPDFDYTNISGIRTFTLNKNFSTNGYSLRNITHDSNSDQVIIDGNNKTVTITDNSFNGLFFAGNERDGNDKPTIIRNFKIKSSVNINVGLAKVTGYVQFGNCHLELIGNINSEGGGLANNSDSDNINTKIFFTNCSVKVFGKIGANAGPLIGYVRQNLGNSIYNITNCHTIIIDKNSLIGDKTLGSAAGAFVGNGISNDVAITGSYCLFNGSMAWGSGIIGGKFLGSPRLTINKFYAVTFITAVTPANPANPDDPSQSAYLLSSYFNGLVSHSPLFNIVNVLFLNLGFNLNNIYCGLSIETLLGGVYIHANYNDFDEAFDSIPNFFGPVYQTYDINLTGFNRSFISYDSLSPDFTYDISNQALLTYSRLSNFTIPNTLFSSTPFTPSLPTIIHGNGTLSYNSSDESVATVDYSSGEITMLRTGSVTITAILSSTNEYVETTVNANFQIYSNGNSNGNSSSNKSILSQRNLKLYNNYRAYRFNGKVAWIVFRNWWRRWGQIKNLPTKKLKI